jgi:hypothetical protein
VSVAMQEAGVETTGEQALKRGFRPHDRGFVSGLPPSSGERRSQIGSSLDGGFATAAGLQPWAPASRSEGHSVSLRLGREVSSGGRLWLHPAAIGEPNRPSRGRRRS